ncbi:MAG: twin-arginine translocase TatA/TatE family subunit [Acidobacteriota bacterium]
MFLFILESIGTSELILIGIIALIFLGPRKLPQIAKTIGKTMADFRNTTHEFKSTWEREVNFAEETEALRSGELPPSEPAPIPRSTSIDDSSINTIALPEIKPVQPDMFSTTPPASEPSERPEDQIVDASDKKNWL